MGADVIPLLKNLTNMDQNTKTTTATEPKVAREAVLHEHPSGAPHITVDDGGTFRHYCGHAPTGEVMRLIPIVLSAPTKPVVKPSGPAKVTSEAYRSGWDAICWRAGTREAKPS